MDRYGVFISHKSEDWALAGRVYDYLNANGCYPFIDAVSLHQGKFDKDLEMQIKQCPYFLCILSPNTFKDLEPDSWIRKEIGIALRRKKSFLLLATKEFEWPSELPEDISDIRNNNLNFYRVERTNFFDIMKRLCQTDIKREKLHGIEDWKVQNRLQANTYISSRENIEKTVATLENRFGEELVRCVERGETYQGLNRIKLIHMSCYAASLIFAPAINMVDERAFDRGKLFNILAELLKDEEFSLEIIITAPGCNAAVESDSSAKLGNSRLEDCPEAVFLSSYCRLNSLLEQDPVFIKARKEKRFNFYVTDISMPYSIFEIKYKDGYGAHDHVKVDLYSEGLVSNMDRRCMVFFKDADPGNHDFFIQRYKYIRNIRKSRELIKEGHDRWMQQWDELKGDLGYDE